MVIPFIVEYMKAISLHSIIPVRSNPQESSEQQTQILFGETCTIIEQKPRWNRVKLDSDGQEGWVDSKMVTPMAKKEYNTYKKDYEQAALVAYPMAYAISENNGQTIPLTAGTRLTKYNNGSFSVLGVRFRIDPAMVLANYLTFDEQHLIQVLRFFLNVPYLWGGKNAMGMDCSGFTQVIMSLFGKKLLRNASQQATQGRTITTLKNAKAGDLVFFDHFDNENTQKERKITHVGILLDAERVIHCSGRVKVEKIDQKGILSREYTSNTNKEGIYTHRLLAIKRV